MVNPPRPIALIYSRLRWLFVRSPLYRLKKHLQFHLQIKALEKRRHCTHTQFPVSDHVRPHNPLVSVVIPVYDRTDLLRCAIDSALQQTETNLEVILVTDGSPPETLAVINEYSHDPRVRVFHYPRSSGNAVRGRNKGILEARGRYVAFLDSDDVALPHRLWRSVHFLERGLCDVVYGAWCAVIDGSREVQGLHNGQVVFSGDADLASLRKTCIPCQSTVTVRRSLFEKAGYVKPQMKYREDHELWVRLAFFGGTFLALPYVLTKLRLHRGNNELNFLDTDEHWFKKVHDEYQSRGPRPRKFGFVVSSTEDCSLLLGYATLLLAHGHDALLMTQAELPPPGYNTESGVPWVSLSDPRRYVFSSFDLLFSDSQEALLLLSEISATVRVLLLTGKQSTTLPLTTGVTVTTTWPGCPPIDGDAQWRCSTVLPPPTCLLATKPVAPHANRARRVLIDGASPQELSTCVEQLSSLECEVWVVVRSGDLPTLPFPIRVVVCPDPTAVEAVYRNCGIVVLCASHPSPDDALHVMACGSALIVDESQEQQEYIAHQQNALVTPLQNLRATVMTLLETPLAKTVIAGGYVTADERTVATLLALLPGENQPASHNSLSKEQRQELFLDS